MLQFLKSSQRLTGREQEFGVLNEGVRGVALPRLKNGAIGGLGVACFTRYLGCQEPGLPNLSFAIENCIGLGSTQSTRKTSDDGEMLK